MATSDCNAEAPAGVLRGRQNELLFPSRTEVLPWGPTAISMSSPSGREGLTLQIVAVCCSQMVSSSMSDTWQKGDGDSGREVTAHSLEHLGVTGFQWGAPI